MDVLPEVDNLAFDIGAFVARRNDTNELPALQTIERVEDLALWVLQFSKDRVGRPYLSAKEISRILADVFEVSADEAAIRMALSRAGRKVHAQNCGGTKRFTIMQKGRDALVDASSDRVILVDPAQPRTAIQRLSDLLGGLSGTVRICDPWIDRKTFEVLAMIPEASEVRLLSTAPKDGMAFHRHYRVYKSDHKLTEIRTVPAGQLHDRYLLAGRDMWLIGHSLNAIGTKQSFVVKVGGDVPLQVEKWFDAVWTTATPL